MNSTKPHILDYGLESAWVARHKHRHKHGDGEIASELKHLQ